MNGIGFVQLFSACFGVIGSLFFAIGVMRQTIEAMANLSGSYYDWNPHMVTALAQQKAEYLFGGGLIVVAFMLQLLSYFATSDTVLTPGQTQAAPWIAVVGTAIFFVGFHAASKAVAGKYEVRITELVKKRSKSAA